MYYVSAVSNDMVSIVDTEDDVIDTFSIQYLENNWEVIKPLGIIGLDWGIIYTVNGARYGVNTRTYGYPSIMKPSEICKLLSSEGNYNKACFIKEVCNVENELSKVNKDTTIPKGKPINIFICYDVNNPGTFYANTFRKNAVLNYFRSAGFNVIKIDAKYRPDNLSLVEYAKYCIRYIKL
jgi:hypothetical protein